MKFFPGDFYIFPGEFLLVCFSETLRRVFSFFLGFLLDYTLEFDYNYNIQVPFSTGKYSVVFPVITDICINILFRRK